MLHDIDDSLAPHNHSEVAAAILKPYAAKPSYWVIQRHDPFQSNYAEAMLAS